MFSSIDASKWVYWRLLLLELTRMLFPSPVEGFPFPNLQLFHH